MIPDHHALLDEWEQLPHHRNKCFIRDGIIDGDRWKRATRKVLFLLKEAYDEPRALEGWDLCELIRDDWQGPKYKVWRTAAYWAYAAQKGTPHAVPECPSDDGGKDAAAEALLASAVVNVKKSSGKKASDLDEIKVYATRDREFLLKQIDIIDPRIVICGYVWPAVRHLWDGARQIYDNVYQINGRYFVDYWHPGNRYPHQLNYYALSFLLQSAGAFGRCSRRRS